MESVDWDKLAWLFGCKEKLQFWLDELITQAPQELDLLTKAHVDEQLKVQVVALFSGIASLLHDPLLTGACENLAKASPGEYQDKLSNVAEYYQSLLIQVRHYRDH
ncbi:hypothetical protein [Celerinatantimonas yamalensis]|uniref:Uncharacterized protein n=1 Tax=Celerinatantimonas yamalensis TaxID=559956 RepID=A0ABW9GDR8_9GAMM